MMNTIRMMRLVLVMLSLCVLGRGPAQAAGEDEEAVRTAFSGFYAALEKLFEGDVQPMTEVWSHADDVTYMGPDGSYLVGWKDVLADWRKQADRKLGGKVEPQRIHVNVGSKIAVVHGVEVGENTNTGGDSGAVRIRATSVFRLENGQWKMIGHHTDLLPYLTE